MTQRKIIIDTDPGCDDMLAILLMCAAPSIDICAVTTVAGNQSLQKVTNNAQYILKLAKNPALPLCSGADMPLVQKSIRATVHGKTGLGDVEVTEVAYLNGKAIDTILSIVEKNPGEVSLLILGPQTNIAKAILKNPEIMKMAKEFVIMGGAFNVPGNQTEVAEFNIYADPEAAAIVARFPAKKTYIPLDICNQIQVPISDFSRINDRTLRNVVTAALRPYTQNIQRTELKTKGALMYDVLAAYCLLKPDLCKAINGRVFIETDEASKYGQTTFEECSISENELNNGSVVFSIPQLQFLDDFFATLNQVF